VVRRTAEGLQRRPQLTDAVTRAFTSGDPSAAAEANAVHEAMAQIIAVAFDEPELTPRHHAIAAVLTDVLLANTVAWVTKRLTMEQITERLDLAVSLLVTAAD
jgi:hypothetical protein